MYSILLEEGDPVKELLAEFRASIVVTVLLAFLCCGLYPVVVWGIAQAAFPEKANGSLLKVGGNVVGSSLIGQGFKGPAYFHPRPSAAGRGYDAANSGGTNLGPTSKRLIEDVRDRVAAYRAENGLSSDTPVPADAVTSSASGLDPHISPANANLQAGRVASARGIPKEEVLRRIRAHTEGRTLGFLGESRVNVLTLNLSLDGRM
jgi:potassium-transporting ATPase KdpC subunit